MIYLSWDIYPEGDSNFLSINLGVIPFRDAMAAATSLGFQPELVQMPVLNPSGVQIHLLLWQGAIADTPDDLEEKFDALAELIDDQAIRYATGGEVKQNAL